jgi:hypothetical protein
MTTDLIEVNRAGLHSALGQLDDLKTLLPLIEEAEQLVAMAKVIGPVNDAASREQTGHLRVRASAFKKKIVEMAKPIKDKFHGLHKAACDAEKGFTDHVDRFVKTLDTRMLAWDAEVERIRRQREEQLRRQLAEEEEKKRLEQAVTLEKAGKKEEAERLIAAPISEPVVVLQSEKPKVDGLASTGGYGFTIEHEHLIPRAYLKVDESKIRKQVDNLGMLANIPGVNVFPVSGFKATGRARR